MTDEPQIRLGCISAPLVLIVLAFYYAIRLAWLCVVVIAAVICALAELCDETYRAVQKGRSYGNRIPPA